MDAGKKEDGDEEDHSSKLWVILKVEEGITSRLTLKRVFVRHQLWISKRHLMLEGLFGVPGTPGHK